MFLSSESLDVYRLCRNISLTVVLFFISSLMFSFLLFCCAVCKETTNKQTKSVIEEQDYKHEHNNKVMNDDYIKYIYIISVIYS